MKVTFNNNKYKKEKENAIMFNKVNELLITKSLEPASQSVSSEFPAVSLKESRGK